MALGVIAILLTMIFTNHNCPSCDRPVDTDGCNYFPGDTLIYEYTGQEVVVVDRWGKDTWGWFYRIQITPPGEYKTVHELALHRRDDCERREL
jgi:hypothetical protein